MEACCTGSGVRTPMMCMAGFHEYLEDSEKGGLLSWCNGCMNPELPTFQLYDCHPDVCGHIAESQGLLLLK